MDHCQVETGAYAGDVFFFSLGALGKLLTKIFQDVQTIEFNFACKFSSSLRIHPGHLQKAWQVSFLNLCPVCFRQIHSVRWK